MVFRKFILQVTRINQLRIVCKKEGKQKILDSVSKKFLDSFNSDINNIKIIEDNLNEEIITIIISFQIEDISDAALKNLFLDISRLSDVISIRSEIYTISEKYEYIYQIYFIDPIKDEEFKALEIKSLKPEFIEEIGQRVLLGFKNKLVLPMTKDFSENLKLTKHDKITIENISTKERFDVGLQIYEHEGKLNKIIIGRPFVKLYGIVVNEITTLSEAISKADMILNKRGYKIIKDNE